MPVSVGEQMSLFIRVTDSANPPHQSEASVILNVIPADVHLPRFSSRHYLFSVSEDVAVGTTVGRLQQDSERGKFLKNIHEFDLSF